LKIGSECDQQANRTSVRARQLKERVRHQFSDTEFRGGAEAVDDIVVGGDGILAGELFV